MLLGLPDSPLSIVSCSLIYGAGPLGVFVAARLVCRNCSAQEILDTKALPTEPTNARSYLCIDQCPTRATEDQFELRMCLNGKRLRDEAYEERRPPFVSEGSPSPALSPQSFLNGPIWTGWLIHNTSPGQIYNFLHWTGETRSVQKQSNQGTFPHWTGETRSVQKWSNPGNFMHWTGETRSVRESVRFWKCFALVRGDSVNSEMVQSGNRSLKIIQG